MITRKEFLLTADADHAIAAQQARDYVPPAYIWRIEGSVRKTQVETSNIINGTEERLQNLIGAPETDEQVKAVAIKVLRALRNLYKHEFYINLADPEVSQLFSAAQALGVLNLDEVTRITAAAFYEPEASWPNTTLHDVKIERNDCESKSLTAQNGYLLPTLTQSVEIHQARITAKNPRTNQRQILGRVNLSVAGVYEFKIPTHYLQHTDYQIDDAYGAIE